MQLIVICVLAILAMASAFAPRAALARVANKRSTLQLHPFDFIFSTAPLIAQASDPVWGASAPESYLCFRADRRCHHGLIARLSQSFREAQHFGQEWQVMVT